jgi:site-specific recombinase XerD
LFDYARRHGWITSCPLPTQIPKKPPSGAPYIYTHEELRRLLETAENFSKPTRQIESDTLRTLLLLLYGAGLRVGEALALNLSDVDLTSAMLTIRDTKFYKTRLVPLGINLNQVLKNYAESRQQADRPQADDSPFLIGKNGARLAYPTVNRSFNQVRAESGIQRSDGARYQPRLHDLRHSFAVHRLTTWYRAGADVQRLLPKLSTYLGHNNLSATQVYLAMTPELLQAAAVRFAQYAFREVNDD